VGSEMCIRDSVRTNLLDQAFQYSILVVDLMVALGVYVVARRRFA